MEPKKLLSKETLEKKKSFSEKFNVILFPEIDKVLNDLNKEASLPRKLKR